MPSLLRVLRAYMDPADLTAEPWRVDVNGKTLMTEPYPYLPRKFPDHLKALAAGDFELRRQQLAEGAK